MSNPSIKTINAYSVFLTKSDVEAVIQALYECDCVATIYDEIIYRADFCFNAICTAYEQEADDNSAAMKALDHGIAIHKGTKHKALERFWKRVLYMLCEKYGNVDKDSSYTSPAGVEDYARSLTWPRDSRYFNETIKVNADFIEVFKVGDDLHLRCPHEDASIMTSVALNINQ